MKTTFVAVGLGFMLASPSFAQQVTAQDFVTQAASGGMYEVESSQLVLEEAQAPAEITEFAQHMVQDHSKANDQLTTIAEQQDLEVPSELQPEEQQLIDELQGADDKAQTYAQQQLTAHQKSVDLFQTYAEQCENA